MQIYLVHFLKPWKAQKGLFMAPYPTEPELDPQAPTTQGPKPKQVPGEKGTGTIFSHCLPASFIVPSRPDPPNPHCVPMEPGQQVWESPHPLSWKMHEVVKQELQAVLELGITEESHSAW